MVAMTWSVFEVMCAFTKCKPISSEVRSA